MVTCQKAIRGFGPYRQKRFLELLVVAGSVLFGGIALTEAHLDAGLSLWPIACNTKEGIRRIFPGASNVSLQRQCIRLLIRSFSHSGAKMSVPRMSAMLCFQRKEATGVMRLTS